MFLFRKIDRGSLALNWLNSCMCSQMDSGFAEGDWILSHVRGCWQSVVWLKQFWFFFTVVLHSSKGSKSVDQKFISHTIPSAIILAKASTRSFQVPTQRKILHFLREGISQPYGKGLGHMENSRTAAILIINIPQPVRHLKTSLHNLSFFHLYWYDRSY